MSDPAPAAPVLRRWIEDARARSLALVADLDDDACMVPRLPIVTPFVWELAHVAWFHEKWVLRHVHGRDPILAQGDALYDSARVPHATRWDLDQPSRPAALDYCRAVHDAVLALLGDREPAAEEVYFFELGVYHEDMHAEAFTYMRQTLGYARPSFCPRSAATGNGCAGDVAVGGGRFQLGAPRSARFVFDNEKWAHEVAVAPFRIARTPVTEAEFAAFVDDGGYARDELWCEEGRAWRDRVRAAHPAYWRRADGGWEHRAFDEWRPVDASLPVSHVNWFEADAWCRWAGRRLPSEAEWEVAAGGFEKRRFPWGDAAPGPEHAHLGWQHAGCGPVAAKAAGDSPWGCRQMIGNVWEWTSSTFEPFPGFVADPYKEYSQPFFGTRKVLRGGSWASTARLLRNTWRNYFEPHRHDVICGFRTCARDR